MKYTRASAAALLAALLLSLQTKAVTHPGLGEITEQKNDIIAEGVSITRLSTTNEAGNSQKAYILEYDPNGGALPIISWGDAVWGKDKLSSMVETALSKQSDSPSEDSDTTVGFRPIIGALNGDFYSMQTGVPLGVMISDGKLISGDDDPADPHFAIGFREDGTAVIGKPEIKLSMTNLSTDSEPIAIEYFNKYPTIWGAYLCDSNFAESTKSTDASLEIVLELEGEFTSEGALIAEVRELVNGKNTPIPEGGAVLTIAEACARYPEFSSIKVGDRLLIETECAEGWSEVMTAIGGGDVILSDGVIPEGIVDEEHEKLSNPRTAVGLREDGSVVFFAVDGRTKASRGITLEELAAAMAELGCVEALNLDGGGSTSVMVKYPGTGECVYVNTPAGGYRAISNGILLVSKYTSDGIPAVLMSKSEDLLVLTGSRIEPECFMLDRAYMPIEPSDEASESVSEPVRPEKLELEFAEDYSDEIGSTDNATFKAGFVPGTYKFNLIGEHDGNPLSGTAEITVTKSLDLLTVTPKSRKLSPGRTAELEVKAVSDGKQVVCTPESFWYTLDGKNTPPSAEYPDAITVGTLGYIDKNGNFVAFEGVSGSVEIGVWFNEFVEYVTITIEDSAGVLADFEDTSQFNDFTVSATGAVSSLSFEPSDKGFKSPSSLKLGYTFKSDGGKLFELQPTEKISIPAQAKSLKLWVSGDISGSMSTTLLDENNNALTLEYKITKDYSMPLGWRELTAVLPESHGELTLDVLLALSDIGEGERILLIDEVSLEIDAEKDALSGLTEHWAREAILTLYDMAVIRDEDCEILEDGSRFYDPAPELTRGEFAKQLVLRLGIDTSLYNDVKSEFEAETPEDKLPYIRAALGCGLMNGYGVDESGKTIFRASAPITREEVCKVIGGLLRDAGSANLTFTDAAEVSDWALESLKKCVTSGVIRGYEDNTLRPKSTVTRAEFAVILGRM